MDRRFYRFRDGEIRGDVERPIAIGIVQGVEAIFAPEIAIDEGSEFIRAARRLIAIDRIAWPCRSVALDAPLAGEVRICGVQTSRSSELLEKGEQVADGLKR